MAGKYFEAMFAARIYCFTAKALQLRSSGPFSLLKGKMTAPMSNANRGIVFGKTVNGYYKFKGDL